MVVGNSHKNSIPDLVADGAHYHGEIRIGDIFEQRDFLSAPVEDALGDRTRPNLKIQDGCNNRCSFCIIPYVRGRSRSAQPDSVIDQVQSSGREISRSRPQRDQPGPLGPRSRRRELVLSISCSASWTKLHVERLRLSSVEPMDWSDALLELVAASPRIAKHVHAPLQSGSDRVLRRMHRKYRPRHYADRILKARVLMPDCAVGADVMTGFPGETEQEFEESRAFIESLPFTYLHVFTYSARPGTPAADAEQVPMEIRKHRTHVLRDLASARIWNFARA